MRNPISQSVARMEASAIREIYDLAMRYDDVVSFILGEPDFDTPPHIVEAAVRAMKDGFTHYTPNAGILPLREAIARKLQRDNGIEADPEREVIVATGATEMLNLVIKTMIDPGDEVILPDPYYPVFRGQIELCGGVVRLARLREADGFAMDPETVAALITPKTKMILINSPSNPTGGVTPKDKLLAIAELARQHDLYILSDEVYQAFLYDGAEHFSIASDPRYKDRTITVGSCSKTYAMTGWRVGYAAANPVIVERMTKLHEFFSSCVNGPAQMAAVAALNGPQDSVAAMVAEYARRRRVVLDRINGIEGLSCHEPMGAFYAFVNVQGTGLNSVTFVHRLLDEAQVSMAPGSGFGPGGEGFARLSYAASIEEIERGCDRIARFVAQL